MRNGDLALFILAFLPSSRGSLALCVIIMKGSHGVMLGFNLLNTVSTFQLYDLTRLGRYYLIRTEQWAILGRLSLLLRVVHVVPSKDSIVSKLKSKKVTIKKN